MDITARQTTLGALFSELSGVLSRHRQVLLAVTVGMAAVNALSAYWLQDRGANGPDSIVGLIAGYFVLRELLSREGLVVARGSARSYIGSAILSSIGIIIGVLCLVIPGLILMARWSLASALVLGQGRHTVDSLQASWAATRDNTGVLLVFGIIVGGGYLILAGAVGVGLGLGNLMGSLVDTTLTALLTAAGSMLGAAAIVAIYRALVGGTREFEEMFA